MLISLKELQLLALPNLTLFIWERQIDIVIHSSWDMVHCNTFQLGGGVLYQPIKDKYKVLSVKGKVGRTTSDSEMKNTSYDVSVGYARIFGDCGVLGAVGFRVCDYKNSYIPDNRFVYISAGLKF